ncbi:hypothetical protein VTK73DRAFT_6028 [Phialemonium thermophilum]|uniref:Peroxin 26 n=1 Tax=Phialemonium thermophilum TaxID=223376 RepID=A0ABR3XWY6_9PEZI
MGVKGTDTADTSPTVSDSFSPHLLSASISSLSSSLSTRQSSSYISKTYRQASTLFLTRRLPEALSTLQPLITPPAPEDTNGIQEPAPVARASRSTRIKVWSLYLTILNAILEMDPAEGKEAFGTQEWRAICHKVREGEVWEEVVRNGYHGLEGNVDSEVVINLATLLLAHARSQTLNQKRLETYLASVNTPNLDISDRFGPEPSPRRPQARHRSPSKISGANTPRDLNARVKILELYTLHVLIRNNEWDYAREFISMNSVLDEERREAFLQALQSLQEEQQEADRRQMEEKRRQEEQLRQDIEEAKRLRAENEERERRWLEAERENGTLQEPAGSEVDYGVDQVRSAGTAPNRRGKSRPLLRQSGNLKASPSSSGPKKNTTAVTTPSIGTRAVLVLSSIRTLVENTSSSFRSNPALLIRMLAFIVGLLLMFTRRSIRERVARILGTSWDRIRATAGMGVKVSYL